MVDVDNDTVETHFALGNLYRRRGEVERAIRVHENIMARPSLSDEHRLHAMFALGEDYFHAGLFDRAADYWLQAGLKAAKTWAKVDAVRIFRKGLEAAKLLPDSDDRSRRLLRFELELGDVLYAALGYVTGEGSAAYQRAIVLSAKLGELEATIRALDGLFGTHFNSGQFGKALAASDELIRVGEEGGYLNALVIGLQLLDCTAAHLCDPVRIRDLCAADGHQIEIAPLEAT
jgi:tetratricopeptide (TPR) repeat protein